MNRSLNRDIMKANHMTALGLSLCMFMGMAAAPVTETGSLLLNAMAASDTVKVIYDANGGTIKELYDNEEQKDYGETLTRNVSRGEVTLLDNYNLDTRGMQDGKTREINYDCRIDFDMEYDADEKKHFRKTLAEREGYLQVGWKIVETDTFLPENVVLQSADHVKETGGSSLGTDYTYALDEYPGDTLTLQAVWEEAHTVNFDYNGGVYTDASGETSTSEEHICASSWSCVSYRRYSLPEREGYVFNGWEDADTGEHYEVDEFIATDHDRQLKAVWAKEITITYDPGDQSFSSYQDWIQERIGEDGKIRITAGAGMTVNDTSASWWWLHTPDEVYYATGWFLVGDESGKRYEHGEDFIAADEDMTFVADWKKLIKVTYDYNGGGQTWGGTGFPYRYEGEFEDNDAAEDTQYVIYQTDEGAARNLFYGGDLYKEGCIFLGWQIKGDVDDRLYQCDETVRLKEDTTFVAVWGKTGDVDDDGEFTVADIVAVQKWVLGVSDSRPAKLFAADFCTGDHMNEETYSLDRQINVFDLALMKRALLEQ